MHVFIYVYLNDCDEKVNVQDDECTEEEVELVVQGRTISIRKHIYHISHLSKVLV